MLCSKQMQQILYILWKIHLYYKICTWSIDGWYAFSHIRKKSAQMESGHSSVNFFSLYFSLISDFFVIFLSMSPSLLYLFLVPFSHSFSHILISFQFKSEFKYLKCHTGLSDIVLIKSWNIEGRAQIAKENEKNEEWNIEIITTAAAAAATATATTIRMTSMRAFVCHFV